MGFSGGSSPIPTIACGACMHFWCNIQGVTRTLCPLSFGAIKSGVPSCRCLVCVGKAPGNGVFRWIKPPPPATARSACMRFWCNILGGTRPFCPQILGAIGSGVSSSRCLMHAVQALGIIFIMVAASPAPRPFRGRQSCAFDYPYFLN